jgi:hypothetical protein
MTTRQWSPATLTYHVAAADPAGAVAFALRQVPRRYTRPSPVAVRLVARDPSVSDYPNTYAVELAYIVTLSERCTLYGLPGGYTTAWNAQDRRLADRHPKAQPLITFRATPAQLPARLDAARGWALACWDLVP